MYNNPCWHPSALILIFLLFNIFLLKLLHPHSCLFGSSQVIGLCVILLALLQRLANFIHSYTLTAIDSGKGCFLCKAALFVFSDYTHHLEQTAKVATIQIMLCYPFWLFEKHCDTSRIELSVVIS
ncbi:hypothetical protein F5Y17DRAFT_196297 [Xylariaceae sp. FL0594]|nr:hypothetical protein F5Y17DRAFT_196297 [Xylariaceae sp. FL0594]